MKRGISLVALIITIVVLIILTGVAVLNINAPMEEAIYAKFANDVSVIQESVTMKLLDNEARYAINQKAKLLRWVGIIDGYTEEMANEGIEPPFNNSTIVIKGNRVLKISSEMKKNLNVTEVEFDNYYVDAKGKVYNSGLKIGENTYYTVEDKYISSDIVTSNSEENTTIVSQDVQTYIIQGYVPIYTAEQFLQIGSNIQNYEIRDLNNTVIKASGFNMNSDANYILANNIDFTGFEVEPIAEFSGIFDGNGYTISNIVIDNSNSESDFVPIEFATSTDLVKHPAAIFEKLSDGAIVKKIYVNDISVKGDRTVAVIGGECNGSVLVKDCHVTNVALEVYESSAIGGILAFAYNAGEEIIRVENCSIDNIEIVEQKNTDITYANAALEGNGLLNSAGIVSISKTNLEIVNCIVENSVTASKELASGIVYMQQGKSIYVENCVVEDINLARSTSAGIIAIVKNTNMEITECRCENININANGIAGGMIAYCVNTNETFEITNCIVRNVDFVNGFDTGGIVGHLNSNITVIINNCTVENCDMATTNLYEYGQRAGIVGGCISPINMTGNIVRNITMIGEGCAQGGCIGMLRYGVEQRSTITDCSVDNIIISGTTCEAAGFIGYATNVDFINCHATNLNINTTNSGGGIIGILFSMSNIIDCTVSDSLITSAGAQVGGIIGYTSSSVELLRCDSINNELNGIRDSGGLIGILFNSARINECTVEYNEINSSCNVGAVVGLVKFSSGNLEIDNCSINNIHFNTGGVFGGIAGILDVSTGSIAITNCEVDTAIKSDLTEKNETIGGIIGYLRHSIDAMDTDIVENCIVSNITSSNYCRAGGIIGQLALCNIDVINCDVSNFVIDIVDYSLGGIVGSAGASHLELIDCTVTDIELTNAAHHAGGIIGVANSAYWYGGSYINSASTTNISGCTVTNLVIDATKCGGGILGVIYETEQGETLTTKLSNLTIDQCILSGININAGECVAGLAGFLENNIATLSNCTLTNLTLVPGAIHAGNYVGISTAVTLNETNNITN